MRVNMRVHPGLIPQGGSQPPSSVNPVEACPRGASYIFQLILKYPSECLRVDHDGTIPLSASFAFTLHRGGQPQNANTWGYNTHPSPVKTRRHSRDLPCNRDRVVKLPMDARQEIDQR